MHKIDYLMDCKSKFGLSNYIIVHDYEEVYFNTSVCRSRLNMSPKGKRDARLHSHTIINDILYFVERPVIYDCQTFSTRYCLI